MKIVDLKVNEKHLIKLNQLIEIYNSVSKAIRENANSDNFSLSLDDSLNRARIGIDDQISRIARCMLIRLP